MLVNKLFAKLTYFWCRVVTTSDFCTNATYYVINPLQL